MWPKDNSYTSGNFKLHRDSPLKLESLRALALGLALISPPTLAQDFAKNRVGPHLSDMINLRLQAR